MDAPADATVGGVIAAGVSSPRRLRVGHVRDTVVEMELATGDGRLIKSGARTVKNVTGYDVHRLATGSLGTLGVIVQVALKIRPLPEASLSLTALEGGWPVAERLLEAAPAAASVIASPDNVKIRLEGWRAEVEQMERAVLTSAQFSRERTDELSATAGTATLEAAVPPSRLPEMVRDSARWRALLGVGLAWIDVDTPDELRNVRERAAELGGIAPAIRGPGGLGDTPVPSLKIHRRLKRAFDPAGILAPGRFWDDI